MASEKRLTQTAKRFTLPKISLQYISLTQFHLSDLPEAIPFIFVTSAELDFEA